MPALYNCHHLNEESPEPNGNSSEEKFLLNKKPMMLEEKKGTDNSYDSNNNNNYNNQSDNEDSFGDTQTIGVHPKIGSDSIDEKIPIFSDQNNEQQGPFCQSVKDQFAISLLRLQQDLDSTSRKLSEVENKVDAMNRRIFNDKQRSDKQISGGKSGLFSKSNMYIVMYFGWPVAVFLAMRAFERRSLSSSNK